ncbi:MAG: sulfotransferase [Promethearchaeota archaeon]
MTPIVIGGLGGSGTRLIAKLLISSGVYMGNDLNGAFDNLLFHYLIIRRKLPDFRKFDSYISIFEKIMTRDKLNVCDNLKLTKVFFSDIILRSFSFKFIVKRLINLIGSRCKSQNTKIWGWKNPGTSIFLKKLANYYNDLKYIHVIRHGLDMAYSRNKHQLNNWGILYGINVPEDNDLIPVAQLEYWIKANKKTLKLSKTIRKDSFYLLNFDELCTNPHENIRKLFEFLYLKLDSKTFEKLIKIVRIPSSMGRWKSKDISIFNDNQLNEVVGLGFKL